MRCGDRNKGWFLLNFQSTRQLYEEKKVSTFLPYSPFSTAFSTGCRKCRRPISLLLHHQMTTNTKIIWTLSSLLQSSPYCKLWELVELTTSVFWIGISNVLTTSSLNWFQHTCSSVGLLAKLSLYWKHRNDSLASNPPQREVEEPQNPKTQEVIEKLLVLKVRGKLTLAGTDAMARPRRSHFFADNCHWRLSFEWTTITRVQAVREQLEL